MNNKQQNTKKTEIDLIPLLKFLLKKWWLIILSGLIVALIVFGATKLLIKPTYRSGFTAYINNQPINGEKDKLTSSDVVASQQLTQTYRFMIRSRSVLMSAADLMNCDLSYSQLVSKTSTDIQDKTEIIYVYVDDEDPEFAYQYATAISKTAPKFISEFVEGSSMKIIDYPVQSKAPFGPNYMKYALYGFLAGALIVIIKLIIDYFRDDRIKSEQEIEEVFGIPILGVIPDITVTSHDRGYYGYQNSRLSDGGQDEEQST